jgi:hypothetical protein
MDFGKTQVWLSFQIPYNLLIVCDLRRGEAS